MYQLEYHEDWDRHFYHLHPEIQKHIWKKILHIMEGLQSRHLDHGLPFFVEEVGQDRICYVEDKSNNTRTIYFVGDHKDYERWLREGR